jgi:hypothetical protein
MMNKERRSGAFFETVVSGGLFMIRKVLLAAVIVAVMAAITFPPYKVRWRRMDVTRERPVTRSFFMKTRGELVEFDSTRLALELLSLSIVGGLTLVWPRIFAEKQDGGKG